MSDETLSMDEELRERRAETWRLLIVQGRSYGDVVEHIAAKYDVSESGVRTDISRMGDWVPKLSRIDDEAGHSRVRELRDARQRLQRMAEEAKKDGNFSREERLIGQITKNIQLDVSLCQSLGLTVSEPDKKEHTIKGSETEDWSLETSEGGDG